MSEIELTRRIHLAADQQTAWSIVADYANDVRWRTGVRSMSSDPRGLAVPGARTTEVMRLAGHTWRNVAVVTAVSPFARLTWEVVDGATARGARTVEPTSGGCIVTLDLTVVPTGAVQTLSAPHLARLLDRNLRNDLERLREIVESRWAGRLASPSLAAS